MEIKNKALTRRELADFLKSSGVKVAGTSEQFDGSEGGIWIAAENTPTLFDYYSEEWIDTFGVKPVLDKVVNTAGWYFEWYDAGTIFAWLQD